MAHRRRRLWEGVRDLARQKASLAGRMGRMRQDRASLQQCGIRSAVCRRRCCIACSVPPSPTCSICIWGFLCLRSAFGRIADLQQLPIASEHESERTGRGAVMPCEMDPASAPWLQAASLSGRAPRGRARPAQLQTTSTTTRRVVSSGGCSGTHALFPTLLPKLASDPRKAQTCSMRSPDSYLPQPPVVARSLLVITTR